MNRTVDALNKANDTDCKGVLETVKECVDEYVGEAEQFDDLTMLCFEYKGIE